ncbi:hypothetical protein HPP92_009971 [Vanilla planifolia]|uniref:Uncharacterized protein n=1 Tax=Vanilla planifolia TaxID=51239 RepID=A0A835R9L3_VANPL|nr:hypothetical protein HPP92_009971 [Vanilla planifolia]
MNKFPHGFGARSQFLQFFRRPLLRSRYIRLTKAAVVSCPPQRRVGGNEGFVILASLCYKNVKQVGEETTKEATLTPPFSLENGLLAEHRPPNLLHRIFSLFSNVRPGADLTNFELPPLFNMPKSQLQCYGETVYCIGEDLLTRCARGKSSLERFIAVVAWNISTTRPVIFGWAPFNPVLGETHHVSRGNLNVLLEQVSHHPPVSALHATDEVEN